MANQNRWQPPIPQEQERTDADEQRATDLVSPTDADASDLLNLTINGQFVTIGGFLIGFPPLADPLTFVTVGENDDHITVGENNDRIGVSS